VAPTRSARACRPSCCTMPLPTGTTPPPPPLSPSSSTDTPMDNPGVPPRSAAARLTDRPKHREVLRRADRADPEVDRLHARRNCWAPCQESLGCVSISKARPHSRRPVRQGRFGLRVRTRATGCRRDWGASPSPIRCRSGGQPTRISFLLTNSSAPYLPSSRPEPDRLTPPNGSSAPSAPTIFTYTMPASILSATRSACSVSVVNT
jgi:hypothetical protein